MIKAAATTVCTPKSLSTTKTTCLMVTFLKDSLLYACQSFYPCLAAVRFMCFWPLTSLSQQAESSKSATDFA